MDNSCQKTASDGAVDYRSCVYPVPHVPLMIDDTQPESGIKQLLRHIRPEWPTERIKFKVVFLILVEFYLLCSCFNCWHLFSLPVYVCLVVWFSACSMWFHFGNPAVYGYKFIFFLLLYIYALNSASDQCT